MRAAGVSGPGAGQGPGGGPGYTVEAERTLMQWIQGSCGKEITEATGGDAARGALLAAIAANESGGCRDAYRFSPANHQKVVALIRGEESTLSRLTRAALEKWLGKTRSERERAALLKKLAGLHGYTQIAGYYTVIWNVPLEALHDKALHFELAARRLEELCREFELDPETQPIELGRLWNSEDGNRLRSGVYGWRLGARMRLWGQLGGT